MEPELAQRQAALVFLDYGSFYDSTWAKVNAWAATFVTAPNQHHAVIIFFEGSKDASHGIQAWQEILGSNLIKRLFPSITHLILSGDTGNGFRSYEMLHFLSTLKNRFDYSVELIPLAPSHAHNITDALFAHLNSLFNQLKEVATRGCGSICM